MSSPSTNHLAPSATSPHNSSPPAELRHITSSGALTPLKEPHRDHRLSGRTSQHLSHRLGSRSPASIPSSPTSVHSSSSAIFERDIEPISPSPPPSHPNPHRMARGKLTEQLDQSVPAVLDSAASVLTAASSPSDEQSIAVVAPAPIMSPMSLSRMSSRSPSPTSAHRSPVSRAGSGIYKLPSPSPSLSMPLPMVPSPGSTSQAQRPTVLTQQLPQSGTSTATTSTSSTGPQLPGAYISSTPTTATFSSPSESAESSPTTTTREHPPDELQISTSTSPPSGPGTSTSTSTNPPSPRTAKHRLSFMSYTDLLSSTPSSTMPLSSLTTSASTSDPPQHIPSVLGLPQQHIPGSAAASLHGDGAASGGRNSWYATESAANRGSLFVDDVGGEWEREGLGQGLEERLEALMGVGVNASPGPSPSPGPPPTVPSPAPAGVSKA